MRKQNNYWGSYPENSKAFTNYPLLAIRSASYDPWDAINQLLDMRADRKCDPVDVNRKEPKEYNGHLPLGGKRTCRNGRTLAGKTYAPKIYIDEAWLLERKLRQQYAADFESLRIKLQLEIEAATKARAKAKAKAEAEQEWDSLNTPELASRFHQICSTYPSNPFLGHAAECTQCKRYVLSHHGIPCRDGDFWMGQ